ncbi:MAG: sterol desaturase family protein [Erythrobacter sp.]
MKSARAPSEGRIQLFESRFLEPLTVFPLVGFLAIWPVLLGGIAAAAIFVAPTIWGPALAVLGWLVWTAVEYMLHRFVFHLEPRSARLQQLVFVIHGNHHAEPNDPLRNLMPPIVSIPVASLIWTLFVLTLGTKGNWVFLGFMIGYFIYDLLHYCCHQYAMKGRFGRTLKRHHMRHHFHHQSGNYGISGMIWDRLLATRITSQKTEI